MDDQILLNVKMKVTSPVRLLGCMVLCTLSMVLSCHRTSRSEASAPTSIGSTEVLPPNIAVRFFFEPFLINIIHLPLIVRVLDPNNGEFNNAPSTKAGRTIYVSRPEMKHLLDTLDRLGPRWTRTNLPTVFKPVTELPTIYGMEITETYTNGTANASIKPEEVCALLEKLNPAITAPRARWEFERFRADSECKVPNFDPNLFPGINY